MTTDQSPPAQASDEPMRAAPGVLGYALFREGKQVGVAWSKQQADTWIDVQIVPLTPMRFPDTPRATADVERDAARWRYWRKKYGAECRMIPGAIWHADLPEKLDIAMDLCMPDDASK